MRPKPPEILDITCSNEARERVMATISQINANRSNALSSTGPTTAAGIENCKFNATRHGLAGKQVVTKGENPAEYDQLHHQLVHDHAPSTEHEAMLVEEIAQNWWRLQRARRTEAAVLNKFGDLECVTDPEARRAFLTITRYLNTIERTWRRACSDLAKLQKLRQEEQDELLRAQAIRSFAQTRPAPIGSDSQIPIEPTVPAPTNPVISTASNNPAC